MTDDRKRLIRRALRLLALAESSNRYEAENALRRADEHIRRHGITEAELQTARAGRPAIRSAGKVEQDAWRDEVALAVGRRHGCRPLRAKDTLAFEGHAAVDAVADFWQASKLIKEECDLYWRSHGHGERFSIDRVYKPAFLFAAACAFAGHAIMNGAVDVEEVIALARRLNGFTYAHGCIGLVMDSAVRDGALAGRGIAKRLDREAMEATVARETPLDEKFVLAAGFVFVASNRPGNYAAMFLRGQKLSFRDDVSAFDDGRRRYVWGFERSGAGHGDRVVFATADREMVGEVETSSVRVASRMARVIRDPSGEPLFVEDDGVHLKAV